MVTIAHLYSSLRDFGGVQLDEDYPYVGERRRCHYKPAISRARVTNYTVHRVRRENEIMKLLEEYGPVYVAIDGDALAEYKTGILQKCPHKQTNHAVLLIGYGSDNGVEYWLIKNSWGTAWSARGYGKIRRDVNACGLMDRGAVTATVLPN